MGSGNLISGILGVEKGEAQGYLEKPGPSGERLGVSCH